MRKFPLVSSSRDPHFLALRSLQTYQGRSRTQRYIIEGIRHLARAVEHCAPIESVFLPPRFYQILSAKNSLVDCASKAFPAFVFRTNSTVI